MRFFIHRASSIDDKEPPAPPVTETDEHGDWVIEITSLEELMALMKSAKAELVLSDKRITIYDTYIE